MGTYPCSNCGARADTVNGCPQCGRSVEQEIAELVAGRRVIDARNCLDQLVWVRAGWQYRGMGRPALT